MRRLLLGCQLLWPGGMLLLLVCCYCQPALLGVYCCRCCRCPLLLRAAVSATGWIPLLAAAEPLAELATLPLVLLFWCCCRRWLLWPGEMLLGC